MTKFRALPAVIALTFAALLSTPTVASAAPSTPFAINPAPYGQANGSADSTPIRCVTQVVDAGTVLVTGPTGGRWGCQTEGYVHWLNLSTGATGSSRLVDFPDRGLFHTQFRPGRGQIVLTLLSSRPLVTPGFATVFVR